MNLELRWFSPGPLSENMHQWIKSKESYLQKEVRYDIYLIVPNSATLGIKLRQGRLEIKARVSIQDFRYNNEFKQITGKIEQWSKFSKQLKKQNLESFAELHLSELKVHKKRYQGIIHGILMEVTELQIQEKNYWTLGFDGIGNNQKKLFYSSILQILADFPVTKLSNDQSFGYPEFLWQL